MLESVFDQSVGSKVSHTSDGPYCFHYIDRPRPEFELAASPGPYIDKAIQDRLSIRVPHAMARRLQVADGFRQLVAPSCETRKVQNPENIRISFYSRALAIN